MTIGEQVEGEVGYIRPDGTLSEFVVVSREDDQGILHFMEVVGYSNDVKGGVYVDGREKFKRLFVQRVEPVILVSESFEQSTAEIKPSRYQGSSNPAREANNNSIQRRFNV